MRKFLCLLLVSVIFTLPSFSKVRNESNPQNFSDLGRYIETLETDESDIKYNTENQDNFEEEAIIDVAKRYESNAVELKLEDRSEEALDAVNSERIFKLKVNETQFNIENGIKNENMIWDSSKSFAQSFLSSSSHLAPIPGIINSSKITANITPSLSAKLGQVYLNDANGPSVLFVRANESTYNIGNVITYNGEKYNLSTGSFSSSYNHASSGGAVLSTNSILLPKNTGSLIFGSAFYANEAQDYDTTTGGGFVEYSYGRFKLNAQLGQSKYSNSNKLNTGFYLIPEFKISDSLYLKTRFIRNITNETMQDELALTFKPKNNKNELEFEINTSNQYTNSTNIKQRITLSTSFKI